jgi:hypothetical protein
VCGEHPSMDLARVINYPWLHVALDCGESTDRVKAVVSSLDGWRMLPRCLE